MELQFEYTRKRKEFGKHPNFGDSGNIEICNIQPDEELLEQWKTRPVTTLDIDCIPTVAEHEVNTERHISVARGMSHAEGGWPKEVNVTDFSEKQRFIRKIEMDETFGDTVLMLAKRAQQCVLQNNSINMFEQYFVDETVDHSSEPPNAKTVTLFKDPEEHPRPVSKICWHPDSANKIAVAHSSLSFQSMNDTTPLPSYIWDINNPNRPDQTIIPQSHLCSIAFNKKTSDNLIGGCYNGLIGFWDLRRGSHPVEKTVIEKTHSDPVYDVEWIQSRTGMEFASVSTDGYIYWWDARKLGSGPMDSMLLKDETTNITYGGTSLEYRTDAGATKFLIGTEQGSIITVERKAKKDGDSQKSMKTIYGALSQDIKENNLNNSKHHAPIYAIQRNFMIPKAILTVGDWATRIWMEDIKTPVIFNKYEKTFLTGGCWSPTRAGVFYTCKSNGVVDVWDYYYRQDDPVYQLKVSEEPLTNIVCQSSGKIIATGSRSGTVTVLQVCDALSEQTTQEKPAMTQLFEREMNREKNLQARLLALRRMQKQKELEKKKDNSTGNDEAKDTENGDKTTGDANKPDGMESGRSLQEVEEEFLKLIEKFKPSIEKPDGFTDEIATNQMIQDNDTGAGNENARVN